MVDATHILLSIMTVHAEDIFDGRKLFEFRRKLPLKIPRHVVVYASRGIGKIIGEFEVARVLTDTPDDLWAETFEFAGITRKHFYRYFNGLEHANAIEVFRPKRYATPIDPCALAAARGLTWRPPQSFCYLPLPGLEYLLDGVSSWPTSQRS
jgi:predicted transcriptional regulator